MKAVRAISSQTSANSGWATCARAYAKVWRPLAGGSRGRSQRQLLAGVDRYPRAGALRQDRRREAEHATADHCHLVRAGLHGQAHRSGARTPGERPTATAMAVAMHDQSVAEAFGCHSRSGGTEGPQANGDVEDVVGPCTNGHEPWADL